MARKAAFGEVWDVLREPTVWLNRQAYSESLQAYVDAVKLLFVLHVRSHLSHAKKYDLLNEFPPALETFDEWWEMEALPAHDDYAVDVLNDLDEEGGLEGVRAEEIERLREALK